MRHLQARAIFLDPARQDAGLIERQETLDLVAVAMEEDDIQSSAVIFADHANRRARACLAAECYDGSALPQK